MGIDISNYTSEAIHENTRDIDSVSTLEAMRMIHEEDRKITESIERELPRIAEAVDAISAKINRGGRMIYVGGGLSGRIGILDASEVAPSFGTPYAMVQGMIAGGDEALKRVLSGVEDDRETVIQELKDKDLCSADALIGISASGATPYVVSALEYAKRIGSLTVGIVNNQVTDIHRIADITIGAIVGAEAIAGSTRMKSGTAQKMIANMLSTGVMIKLGRVYRNLLIFVEISNDKLVERVKRAFQDAADISPEETARYLEKADYNAAVALIIHKCSVDAAEAKKLLNDARGNIQLALKQEKSSSLAMIAPVI
jgi:N-acetylmuramic acid 6-phosphate etherase